MFSVDALTFRRILSGMSHILRVKIVGTKIAIFENFSKKGRKSFKPKRMNRQKLNILYLSPWYPHRYDPMFGLFVERHAEAASRFNRIYTIYCLADAHLPAGKMEVEEDSRGDYHAIRVYYGKSRTGFRLWDGFKNLLNYRKAFQKGWELLRSRQVKIDLTHVHILTRAGYLALGLKRKYRIPYMVTEHWSRYQAGNTGYSGRLRKYLTRKVVREAAMITTVTRHLSAAMQAHHLNHPDYRIIYNVVDTALFIPEIKPERDVKKMVHISCFEEKSKNLTGIIRSVRLLSAQRQDFILEMVGEGHDREMAMAYAKEQGVLDRFVVFPGLMEGETLARQLAGADFLVQYSNYENLPVVLNEAMACGLPIVSSDVGGIREILSEDKGILVPKNDDDAFVNAMSRMLDQYASYDSGAIRKFAEAHFSYQAVGRFLDEAYHEIIEKKS